MSRPLQVAYVLIYRGKSRYASMAYLSISAARRVHPDCRIALICDKETPQHVRKNFPALLDLVDRVVVLDSEVENVRARSYQFKTRIRDAVEGDVVYLDSDTLPVRPFDGMARGDWDVAYVQDRTHYSPVKPIYPYWVKDRMARVGWDYPFVKYYNAGIGFYRDNAAVRAMVADWQKRWDTFWSVGDDCDQIPLNCSLSTMPIRVHELPPAFNAMVMVHPSLARGAKIYHFFAGNQVTMGDTLFEYLLQHYEATGTIDWESVDRCVAMDHPWMPPYWPRRLWQTGNRWRALWAAGAKLLKQKAVS
jgi:hypothetical protein